MKYFTRFLSIVICFSFIYVLCFTLVSSAEEPVWTPVSGELDMTIYGMIFIDSVKIEKEGYLVGAFGPGGESDCRGITDVIKADKDDWEYNFTIISDNNKDKIKFKVWDKKSGQIYDIEDTLVFEKNVTTRKDLDRPLEVYPKVGVIGKELNVTLTGSGDFDKNTAISMSLDTGNRKAIIGSSATPGAAPGLTVVCGEDDKVYAYAVYGDLNGYKGGLQITDMSNPKKPEVIASVATGFAFDVVVKQDTAYVAHGDNKSSGLKIIDISNPAKPQVTGSVTTPGYAIDDSVNKPFFGIGITVNNDMVYLADGSAGLQIIDTGNPSNPEIIASLDTAGFASGITLNGNTAYMADGSGGLKIIDISDPLHPEMISSVHTSKDANGVTFFESELYVVCGNLDDCIGTLAIIDVSDPKTPEVTASVNIPGTPRNVTLTSNTEYAADKIFTTTTAYIADGNGGLQVIDMTDPSNAFVNFYVDISGYANGIAIIKNMPYKEEGITVTRDTAYVSHGELDNSKGGLEIIDLSKPLYLNEMGFYVTPAPANGIAVIGNTAYLVYRDWDTHTGGLRIIDVNNPSKPATVGSADIPNKAYDIAVKGDIAYVACHGCGLQIIDISDPGNPDIIGSAHFPHNNSARSIALNEEGNMAYIATGGEKVGTLQIIKVSDPENPVVESYMDLPNEADKIAVNGNTVYVTYCAGNILNKSGLLIIDVSDPSNPVEISSIEAPSGEVEIDVGLFPIKETIYTKLKGIAADNEKNTLYALYSGLPEDVQIGDLLSDLQVGDLPPELQSILKLYLGVSEDVYIRDLEIDLQTEVLSSELQSEGLQIIDVSNPSQPDVVNSVKIEDADFGEEITVSGDVVYAVYGSMGLGDNRIQAINVKDPENPVVLGSVDTIGHAKAITVAQDIAYVAYDKSGLLIVPVPTEIQPIEKEDNNTRKGENESTGGISLKLPDSTNITGNYTLNLFDENRNYNLPGAVTFVEENSNLLKAKAVIVTGKRCPADSGNQECNDDLWEKTKLVTKKAYEILIHQGYFKENIYYLSPEDIDADDDGVSDVDGNASSENLAYAIKTWAKDASELLIYMTGHGGNNEFELDPDDLLNASELKNWLDELQKDMPGTLIVVYDSCYSGSFLNSLSSEDKKRIIITSTLPDQTANFVSQVGVSTEDSFSFHFWDSIASDGGELFTAFSTAKKKMETYYSQNALLDADGDSNANEEIDFISIDGVIIGRGAKVRESKTAVGTSEMIQNVSKEQVLDCETMANFWAEVSDKNNITKIWAVIVPPEDNARSRNDPVLDLPNVELTDPDNDGKYEGSYNGFTMKGTYMINICAMDKQGDYSLPGQTGITRTFSKGDINKDGNIDLIDAISALKVLVGIGTADSCADVNGDGKIGLEEVAYIIIYMNE